MNGEEILTNIQITLIMKKVLLCIVYLLGVCSCTTDTAIEDSDSTTMKSEKEWLAQNSTNSYETKGKKYYRIIDSYQKQYGYPLTELELTGQVQAIITAIGTPPVNNTNAIWATDTAVSAIISDPQGKFYQILSKHDLNSVTSQSILELYYILMDESSTKRTIHKRINTYEKKVLTSDKLNKEDKEMTLSLISVSQFLIDSEALRKDRDWEKAVTNKKINGTIEARQVSIVTFIVLLDNLISDSEN